MSLKGITIKLPEATLRRLKLEARESGLSVASIVRARVEAPQPPGDSSVFSISSDLAGSLAGSATPRTNARRKFRRSQ